MLFACMPPIDEAIADLQSEDPKRRSLAALALGELGANGTWAIPVIVDAIKHEDFNDRLLSGFRRDTIYYGMASLARIAGSAMREGTGADSPNISLAILTLERLTFAAYPRIPRWANHWLVYLHRVAAATDARL